MKGLLGLIVFLLDFVLCSSQCSKRVRISAPIINKEWDNGSPWQSPHEDVKVPIGLPFSRMENEEVEIQECIQLMNIAGKPSRDNTWSIGCHSILSKAFSVSTLIAMKPPLPFFCLIVWKASTAKDEFSWMILPLTKDDWYGEMKLGSKGLRRRAIILEIIL